MPFLCRLRTIHESLRNYIKYYLYQLQDNVKKIKMFHVKHWVQRDVEIIYLLIIHAVEYSTADTPEHAAVSIRPARWLATIRANHSVQTERSVAATSAVLITKSKLSSCYQLCYIRLLIIKWIRLI